VRLELRLRLRNSAILFLIATIVSFFFVKKYFILLTTPARQAWMVALPGQEVVFRFISPTEPFWVYTKLAIYGALLFASPLVIILLIASAMSGALGQRVDALIIVTMVVLSVGINFWQS